MTGATGIGKTTFLAEVAIDLSQQNVSTLFGSFEIRNHRVGRTMMTQMAGKSLVGDPESFEHTADRMAQIPLRFLRFFGSAELDSVVDSLEYAIQKHGVQHIVLDNLQFMIGTPGRGVDRFDLQDTAVARFRRLASERDVHVTVVIHPRKNNPNDTTLTMQSVFGTAKATQEADNVLVLQTSRAFRYLEVCKNRFDGTLGVLPVQFDTESLLFKELHPVDMSAPQRTALDQLAKWQGLNTRHLTFPAGQAPGQRKPRASKQQQQQQAVEQTPPPVDLGMEGETEEP